MKDAKNKKDNSQNPDTVFSKTVSSGKRIYYLDVKKNSKDEFFIVITENKKVLTKDSSQPAVHFEKHKIFLFNEDFDKFLNALDETISFTKDKNNNAITDDLLIPFEDNNDNIDPIKLTIDF